MQAAQSITVPVHHSAWLARFELAACLFAVITWQFVMLPVAISVIGTALIIAASARALGRRRRVTSLSYHAENGWQLTLAGGERRAATVLTPYWVSPLVIAATFYLPAQRGMRAERLPLCIAADATRADHHRRLRVLLTTLKPWREND